MEIESSESVPPATIAISPTQKASLAELRIEKRYSQYEQISLENRENYFRISCRPITKRAEDDLELISDIVTWGELYLHHFPIGTYLCARCLRPLYSSNDKYKGPCVWPSFRKPIGPNSISTTTVRPYNQYTVTVKEVYCGGCDLFIGHQFEDGKAKGDIHPEAHWRH